MKPIKLGIMLAGVFLCVSAAYAGPITIGFDVFQQTDNSPCVIGNSSCNQPAGFTDFEIASVGATSYDYYSPIYYVRTDGISAVGPDNVIPAAFSIGFDVNYAKGQGLEVLEFFYVYVLSSAPSPFPNSYGGGVASPGLANAQDGANSYNGPYAVNVNTGNGYSDIVLNGFTLSPGSYVYFRAGVSNETGGMDQFFVIPQGTTPVPEPSTLLLLGIGIAGVAAISRKRKNG